MKLVSWNVNGLRACVKKGFFDFFKEIDADIFAVQETKMQEDQKEFAVDGYYEYWFDAEKKGYSGTLIYTKQKPLNATIGIEGKYLDEGRLITLEFDNFYFINTYVPNSQDELKRLDYRMEYNDTLKAYLTKLKKHKPVIICGDLNVAHQEIDIRNPDTNRRNAGFTDEEREKMTELLNSGFIDTFRYLHPNKIQYSWWSYRFQARERNVGWRIDYFLVSEDLKDKLQTAKIHDDTYGGDHCPVSITIKL